MQLKSRKVGTHALKRRYHRTISQDKYLLVDLRMIVPFKWHEDMLLNSNHSSTKIWLFFHTKITLKINHVTYSSSFYIPFSLIWSFADSPIFPHTGSVQDHMPNCLNSLVNIYQKSHFREKYIQQRGREIHTKLDFDQKCGQGNLYTLPSVFFFSSCAYITLHFSKKWKEEVHFHSKSYLPFSNADFRIY